MTPTPKMSDRNADQIAYWNGAGGEQWARRQEAQDRLLAPVTTLVDTAAKARAGEHVLDVGCGCGSTTVALARCVSPGGHAHGIDVSAEMLAVARADGAGLPVTFTQADATVHAFAPRSIDLLYSRFGVMFFADPVASFTNLHTAMKPSGRLVFACWQEPKKNPWMIAPLMAAYKHVPKLPPVGPEDPGPFAFADPNRVTRILSAAGFREPMLTPHTVTFDIAHGQGLDAAVAAAIDFGPTSRALEDQPATAADAVRASIREALAPFEKNGAVHLGGAIWIVTAGV